MVASAGATCCLMHMLGEPRTMQKDPRYGDVVSDVKAFLEERLAFAVGEGVPEERVLLDPGIGFGKTLEHNLELLRRLEEIVAIGRPVVIGTSRKSFLGKITGRDEQRPRPRHDRHERASRWERGARIFRVHDVAPMPMRSRWPVLLGRAWMRTTTGSSPTTMTTSPQSPPSPSRSPGCRSTPPRRRRRGARGRPATGVRPVVRGGGVRRHRDRPRGGHRRLRRRVPAGRPRGAGAVVQDARAAGVRDLRSHDRPLRRRRRSRCARPSRSRQFRFPWRKSP